MIKIQIAKKQKSEREKKLFYVQKTNKSIDFSSLSLCSNEFISKSRAFVCCMHASHNFFLLSILPHFLLIVLTLIKVY